MLLLVEILAAATVIATIVHAIQPSARTMAISIIGMSVTFSVGLLGTILSLIHSFAAVAGVDPSMKATLLAMGISEAMNCTAVAVATVPAWVVPFVIGQVRRARLRRAAASAAKVG
jgi:hypothetical protein